MAMGMGKEEARQYAASMIAIPGEVAPTFSTRGATISKRQAEDLAAAIKDIPDLAETKILAVGARPSKKEVDGFMKSVRDVPAEKRSIIRTIAELGGLDAARTAVEKFKGKTVTVKTEANLAGANAAKKAIADVRSKTVTITTRWTGGKQPGLAEGGLVHDGVAAVGFRPVTRLAGGGPVPGQSPHPKADNVPIWATAGEFMQPVASVGYYGLGVMEAMRRQLIPRQFFNAMGLADGGSVDPYMVAASRPVVGSAAASVGSQGVDAPQTVVQITNHYPQAEPTSLTTKRALQYAAALGVG